MHQCAGDWTQYRQLSRLDSRLHIALTLRLDQFRDSIVYTAQHVDNQEDRPGSAYFSNENLLSDATKTQCLRHQLLHPGVRRLQYGRHAPVHDLGADQPVAFSRYCRFGAKSLHAHLHATFLPR
jgi:hypothetical protein